MSYSIRPLTADDADAYRELRLEGLRNHPYAFASSYETAVQRPDDYWREALQRLSFFGAFAEDGRPVGLVAFDQSNGDKDRHRGWLLQMYVRPEMRGTGCAMALVEALIDHARDRVLQVHLGVWDQNLPAIRLYQRAGFEIYATDRRAYYVDGQFVGDHLMVRYLDTAPGKNEND